MLVVTSSDPPMSCVFSDLPDGFVLVAVVGISCDYYVLVFVDERVAVVLLLRILEFRS